MSTSSSTDPAVGTAGLTFVRVLPAEEAYDFEYVASRLADPRLLTDAVALAVFRLPLLAVPVGVGRRGGRMTVDHEIVGEAMVAVLHGRPGFPRVRMRKVSHGFVVEWGDSAPEGAGALETARFYGLTGAASRSAAAGGLHAGTAA